MSITLNQVADSVSVRKLRVPLQPSGRETLVSLSVVSVSVREAAGIGSRFPPRLREVLSQAVGRVSPEELPGLLAKHEADPANFDARIEQNIRELAPSLVMAKNEPVSPPGGFNSDLVIRTADTAVCVEIEKGHLSRFELDILKMLAFATRCKSERPAVRCFGAFIVPTDNVVARHVTGGGRESSYEYLTRLSRLVVKIAPLAVEDILLVGYGVSNPAPGLRTQRKRGARGESVIRSDGLLPGEVLATRLGGCPPELIVWLRKRLAATCQGLQEKLNPRGRYLGYARRGRSDVLYVYLQRQRLVIDIRLPADRAGQVRRLGFDVRPRLNYQGRAGWLTGIRVPYGTQKRGALVDLALEPLRD